MSASVAPVDDVAGPQTDRVSNPGPDSAEVEALAAEMLRAKSQLRVGESVIVHHQDGSIRLTMTEAGLAISPAGLSLGGSSGAEFAPQGWCHTAAMAAVYTIGAAAFAAAALVGGITVFGVFIPAYAASAMSIALSAGAGLSALVSLYIC